MTVEYNELQSTEGIIKKTSRLREKQYLKSVRKMTVDKFILEREYLKYLGFSDEDLGLAFQNVSFVEANFWDKMFLQKNMNEFVFLTNDEFKKTLENNYLETSKIVSDVMGREIDVKTAPKEEVVEALIKTDKKLKESYKEIEQSKERTYEQTNKKAEILGQIKAVGLNLNVVYALSNDKLKNHINQVSKVEYGNENYVTENLIEPRSVDFLKSRLLNMSIDNKNKKQNKPSFKKA